MLAERGACWALWDSVERQVAFRHPPYLRLLVAQEIAAAVLRLESAFRLHRDEDFAVFGEVVEPSDGGV